MFVQERLQPIVVRPVGVSSTSYQQIVRFRQGKMICRWDQVRLRSKGICRRPADGSCVGATKMCKVSFVRTPLCSRGWGRLGALTIPDLLETVILSAAKNLNDSTHTRPFAALRVTTFTVLLECLRLALLFWKVQDVKHSPVNLQGFGHLRSCRQVCRFDYGHIDQMFLGGADRLQFRIE